MTCRHRSKAVAFGTFICAFVVGLFDTACAQTIVFSNIPSGSTSSQLLPTVGAPANIDTSGSPSWLSVAFAQWAGDPEAAVYTVTVNTVGIAVNSSVSGKFPLNISGNPAF